MVFELLTLFLFQEAPLWISMAMSKWVPNIEDKDAFHEYQEYNES